MPPKVLVTAGGQPSEVIHISLRRSHSKYLVIPLCSERCQCKTFLWNEIVATNQLLYFVPNGALSRHAVSTPYEVALNASLRLCIMTEVFKQLCPIPKIQTYSTIQLSCFAVALFIMFSPLV